MRSFVINGTMLLAFLGHQLSFGSALPFFQTIPSSVVMINPLLPVNKPHAILRPTTTISPTLLRSSKKDNAIDVEFEQFQEPETPSARRTRTAAADETDTTPTSLLEASLSLGDPELTDIPYEFLDPESSTGRYIDCRIAFVAESHGITYSIGTPCDAQVALFCEGNAGTSVNPTNVANVEQTQYFLDPDEDANFELLEKAAAVFVEQYGSTLEAVFKRTPRTLTIEGDLDSITGDWRRNGAGGDELGEDNLSDNILKNFSEIEDDAESDEFFDNFFKEQLGNGYAEEFSGPNREIDKKAEEMMEFFSVPGVGTQQDDDEGVKEMMEDVFNGRDFAKAIELEKDDESKTVETGLRLLGFTGPDGKAYSLVKLLQPMVLVAKVDQELEPDQRVLLTVEEAKIIVPRLEAEFKKEFEELNNK